MRFEETHEGNYRIFAGALEAPRGDGYIAALVVNRVNSTGTGSGTGHGHGAGTGTGTGAGTGIREAFRDDSLACGHRWPCADDALRYAMNKARELIRSRSESLVC
jgi:hypothetical protein